MKRLALCAAAVLTLLVPSPAHAAETPAKCGKYLGTFYWLRATDGSGFLSGDVEEDALYHCPKVNGSPEVKYYCSDGQMNDDKIGTDLCPH
ncbi:hypothetical protein ACIQM4_04645 [Streptomyces sp. NPDC091272]|uniref:hypothetical protein n=1 Tax=Streptomyces sp. NPDC091272 TaxID=3365981 RepID=UPI00382DBCD9